MPSLGKRRRALLAWPAGVSLAWVGFSELLLPALLSWAHRSPSLAGIPAVAQAKARMALPAMVAAAQVYGRWVAAGGLCYLALAWLLTDRRFPRRLRRGATAHSLGLIRAWVCAVAIAVTLLERFHTTALLPREMLRAMGIFDLLRHIPGFDGLLRSYAGLEALQILGLALLAAAALGLWTRFTMPAAALFFLLEQGVLRAYTRFFHTGLVLLYVLLVLAISPCGEGFSLDRLRRERPAPGRPSMRYAWPRWCLWLVIALPYFEAGLMKLRRGGLDWFHPDSLRGIVLADSHGPLAAVLPGGGFLELPAGLVSALAAGAVGLEIAYVAVLAWKAARQVLPALMVVFHLATWLLQGVLFLDLLLLQAIFWFGERVSPRAGGASSPPPNAGLEAVRATRRGRRRAAALGALLLLAWSFRLELFPLSAMQMYATADLSGTAEYLKLRGRFASGATLEMRIEDCVPALRDARHRWVLGQVWGGRRRQAGLRLLEICAERFPPRRDGDPLEVLVVERWRWRFAAVPRQEPVLVHRLEVPRAP